MSHETNPFRLSMLQRSESPFDGELANPVVSPTTFSSLSNGPQPPPARFPQREPEPRADPGGNPGGNRSSNPFRVDLSDEPQKASTLLEPPPYYESEMRRHSDPNITDEKSRLSVDESFREGYERGLRMARERERQRRRRERGERSERSERSERHERSERGHSDRPRSDRERSASGEHQQQRQRSKSESASKSSYRGAHRSSGRRHHQSGKPNASLDVIDKMDVTGFYGPGTFHHDGPFDACTPQRNKTSSRGVTPISAFPANGPNNSLAIEDPSISAFRKEEEVYGRQVDRAPEEAQASFDPHDRARPVHGQRTMGLGTSTFLDGTPASRDAIEQAGRERSVSFGRSKSLLRRAGSGARRPSPQVRHGSDPENDYSHEFDEREESQPKTSLLSRVRSLRASGRH